MPHVQQTVDPVRLWVDSSDMPKNIPHADEVGCSSAPLESMAYFFGSYCSKYNEDFMLCKNENPHPEHCLKEGRRVTRCALDLIEKLKNNCDQQWEKHWQCLDMKNHQLFKCREEERVFNQCVFDKLGIKKVLPGAEGAVPIFEKEKTLY